MHLRSAENSSCRWCFVANRDVYRFLSCAVNHCANLVVSISHWISSCSIIWTEFCVILQATNGCNQRLVKDTKSGKSKQSLEPIPIITACLTYMGFYFLMLLGFLNQLLFVPKVAKERNREVSHPCVIPPRTRLIVRELLLSIVFCSGETQIQIVAISFWQGYAPLYDSFEQFYLRYVYRRIRDCFNRPICSVPGSEVTLKDRITKDSCWTFEWVW